MLIVEFIEKLKKYSEDTYGEEKTAYIKAIVALENLRKITCSNVVKPNFTTVAGNLLPTA